MIVKAEKNALFYALSLSHLPNKPRNKFHQGYKFHPSPNLRFVKFLGWGQGSKKDFQYKTTSDT